MGKKAITRLTMAVIAIIIIVVAGIGGYYAYTTMLAPEAEEKVLNIGMPRDARALDPGIIKTNIEVSVERLIYEPLIKMTLVDGKLETEPWIAESWKPIDEKTWEFKIREGVKFHNGRELTAYDVAWNLNRVAHWTNITTPKFALGLLRNFEATDKYTLRVGADKPVTAAVSFMGETHNLPNACPEEVLKEGFGQTHFCGTGPYKCIEKIKGERIVFVKNEDYWNKDHPPQFDKIIVKIIVDSTARVTALETGEVDYITHAPPAELDRLIEKGFEVDIYRHHRNIYYWINTAKEPTDDIRVRQAINYAVDKKTISKELYYGVVTPADGVFHEGPPDRTMFASARNEPMFPYDPEKAKQLLADAGYGPDNPCPITLYNSVDRYLLDKELGEAIAGYLNKNGFKVTFNQMEFGALQGIAIKNCRLVIEGKADPRDFEYNMGIYSLAIVTMDLDWGFNLNFWSQSTESMTFWWMPGRYGTAMPEKFDDLYIEQSATLDPEKRCETMKEMQQMIYDYVPYLFMHSESTVAARVSNLKGVTSRTEYYYWYDAYFEGESKSMMAGPYTMALVAPSLSSVYLKDIMASVVSCIKD